MKEINSEEINKTKIIYIISVICSILIIVAILFTVFLPKIKYSENENRYLQKFPKFSIQNITSGKFMTDFDSYMSDHYAFRNFWVSMKANIEIMLGKKENNNVYIGKDQYLIEKYEEIDFDSLNEIANNLNKFAENNKNIDLTFMLVPNSIAINKDKLPSFSSPDSQTLAIEHFYNILSNDYTKLDTEKVLLSAKEKYNDVYFRLDHHWNSYGAYSAYELYAQIKGFKAHDINDYEISVVTDNFNGTLYSKSNIYNLKPDKIERFKLKDETKYTVQYLGKDGIFDTIYVDSYLDKKDKYSYFLDNNLPLTIIKNKESKENKNLLVIKDSYANILMQFFIDHYDTIYIIDPRFYKESITDCIESNSIDNVLFVYNLATMEKDNAIKAIK